METQQDRTLPKLLSVNQFCTEHPAFKSSGLRHYFFTKGGPNEIQGVYRFGRRVLIDPTEFILGIKNGDAKVIAGRVSK